MVQDKVKELNQKLEELNNMACDVVNFSGRRIIDGYVENEYFGVDISTAKVEVLENGNILIVPKPDNF